MELGVISLSDLQIDRATGRPHSAEQEIAPAVRASVSVRS